MKIIAAPKSHGKTTEAVNYCLYHNYTLIVYNDKERQRIRDTFPKVPRIVTIEEVSSDKGIWVDGYVIDGLDRIIQRIISNAPIKLVTLTKEQEDFHVMIH